MATLYVSSRTVRFDPDDPQQSMFTLLYGDEVETGAAPGTGRVSATYRGRLGKIDSARLTTKHPCELYFIDAGQGDATFIVTPGFKKILIDGGRGAEAFQFLVWKYRLDLPASPDVDIDLLVISHADEDHLAGLKNIVGHPHIHVKRVIHSGIGKFKSGFNTKLGARVNTPQGLMLTTRHDAITDLAGLSLTRDMDDWRKVIVQENTAFGAVDSSSAPIDVGDPAVTLTVLGPHLSQVNGAPAYAWFDAPSDAAGAHTVNGHSVVLRLDCGNVRVLFPGDINIEGSDHLLALPGFAAQAASHVLKAPHHGSHEFTRSFLEAVRPQTTVISSGDDHDYGHPRPNFLGVIGAASRSDEPLVYSTELAGNFIVDADAAAADATDDANALNGALIGQARRRFKRYLNGLINVRTDGTTIYTARRVAASFQFITYEQDLVP